MAKKAIPADLKRRVRQRCGYGCVPRCLSAEKDSDITVELFKYFGNIRFVMMPLFFTAIGALAVAYWKILSTDMPDIRILGVLLATGIVVSLIFLIYEVAYSKVSYLVSKKLPNHLADLRHKGMFKKTKWFGWVTAFTLALYFSPILVVLFVVWKSPGLYSGPEVSSYYITNQCVKENTKIVAIPNKDESLWFIQVHLKDKNLKELRNSYSVLGDKINFVYKDKSFYQFAVLSKPVNPIVIGVKSSENDSKKLIDSINGNNKKCGLIN